MTQGTSTVEGRRPPAPVPFSLFRELLYQALATAAVVLGFRYIGWRWLHSLNFEALWFAVPLVIAETLAIGGTLLFFLSTWRTRDTELPAPPGRVAEVQPGTPDRPLIVDVFFPTYNEDVDLVRESVRAAKAMTYPHPIDLRVHVLDDGRRSAAQAMAEEEGASYLTRESNIGFKAGNLRSAMEQTQGDLMVIFDADTQPFPAFLERTLGYFRDPQVAWVQTPQWFYDLDEGIRLPEWLGRRAHLGAPGRHLGRAIEAIVGPVQLGADPLGNDPQMFYDIILRRRNWCNASFCCGAGSVHRREAVMQAALRSFVEQVSGAVEPVTAVVADQQMRRDLHALMVGEAARAVELTPYKFHVSEDIFTSIILHSDKDKRWRSVFHPEALSRMVSPQDLLSWSIQRYKYAGGTLDIFRNDNPLLRPGLTLWQKLCYGATIYSYLSPLWTVIFLLAPIVYFFSGVAPLAAYDLDFYARFVPFVIVNRLAFMVGTWGVNTRRGEQYYLSIFHLVLRAMRSVLRGEQIKFHVTPKTRQEGNFLGLVWPHIAIIGLTVIGALVLGTRVWLGERDLLPAYLANTFWSINNVLSLWPIVAIAISDSRRSAP